ncbi:MAG: hypothetical protein VX740_02065 [Pseudomonadota bacterium]|jgi:hypothetical protein|nr:hypothetical protein [Pseudomonadota bacterium]MEC7702168.1 hypothetical protein [Pseudomonadota bacterium]MED5422203.1 hypothetical protein [Pseudomonadota bacterium]MEE3323053.1 hypothetical protein [Pseudomonadota bacterium]
MNIDPLKKFLQTVNDESLSDEENYLAFTDAHRTETAEILWQREHDIKAAYEKAMSDLRAERRHYSDGLATVMRTRNAAARLQHAIIENMAGNDIIDIERSIIDELDRLACSCDLDLHDDETFALVFNKKLMPELTLDVTNKAEFNALLLTLAQNNDAIILKQHCALIQDEYRAIQNEPYGDDYSARLIAGFISLTEQIENSAAELSINEDDLVKQALTAFNIRSKDDIAAKWQKAQHKIAANNIFQDIDKFDLGTPPNITDELILELSRINFTAKRFKQAILTDKSEEFTALQSEFIDAVQNRKNYRHSAKEMKQIAQILRNPDFIVHNIL